MMTHGDSTHQAKLYNQDAAEIQLGYAHRYATGIFQVLKPNIQRMNLTHEATFLGKLYGEWNKIEKPTFA